MAITNQAVLKKMIKELQAALATGDQTVVKNHIHAVRSLCDLVLEDQTQASGDQEMQKMMGDLGQSPKEQPKVLPNHSMKKTVELDDDEANGNSLFDF